ncbi:TetR/AcrR family transcriptional regulator [Microlunatus speluncae]|uniref:TetR/AcrR family transcriptional regulator n=1 Tax=Microlunatus speluncae TaxID=2594267 RepID=UPI0013756486|nr:helix-turn-helix domain-containing protein [Microlunatus speluncae]
MTDRVVPIDLRRRSDARLQVSRLAAELFWRDGVSATRGEDIAAAAGIATRTLWRYFRSKEACIEPVLVESGRRFMAVLAAWPLNASLEEFLESSRQPGPVVYTVDDVRAMRMVRLGFDEPALRSSWLVVCDDAERQCAQLFGERLGQDETSREVKQIAASVAGAVRVLNDSLSVDFVDRGVTPDGRDVLGMLARAVRDGSSGRIGPAV